MHQDVTELRMRTTQQMPFRPPLAFQPAVELLYLHPDFIEVTQTVYHLLIRAPG